MRFMAVYPLSINSKEIDSFSLYPSVSARIYRGSMKCAGNPVQAEIYEPEGNRTLNPQVSSLWISKPHLTEPLTGALSN